MKFRDLRADEIEVRVQSVKEKGLVALLYKNARTDMDILDETVGPENWERHHYEVKDALFCALKIRVPRYEKDENGKDVVIGYDWIEKCDCGVESNMEAKKGESSDSFKRAGFCWGIGRELYSSPFIWIDAKNCNISNGKCFDKFSVEKIKIEDGKITGLAIWNDTKKCRAFVWQKEVKKDA